MSKRIDQLIAGTTLALLNYKYQLCTAQWCILHLARITGGITYEELYDLITGIGTYTIRKHVSILVKSGYLKTTYTNSGHAIISCTDIGSQHAVLIRSLILDAHKQKKACEPRDPHALL